MGVPMTNDGRVNGGNGRAGHGRAAEAVAHVHTVQFYDSDEFLHETVGRFMADGLANGDPALVIATEPHRAGFASRLTALGMDAEFVCRTGQLTMLDAHETLATFMEDGLPDPDRFRTNVGGVLERIVRTDPSRSVRAFGEMVDLLWKDGHIEAAIRLEEMWNELAVTHRFALLCAYTMSNFSSAADGDAFRQICAHHDHVIPTERYTEATDAAQLREVSALQQRARALESELANRERLEQQLRHALAERNRSLARERAARDEAEAANQSKSDFLAMMSHELRTPLNAIGGYAQLLEQEVHGPISMQQREALTRIQRSQRHLVGLIAEVLDYARVEGGAAQYALEDVSIDDALRAADVDVLPQMRSRALDYRCQEVEPSLIVRADREKVRQILVNLLVNAAKFSERGGSVQVECEASGNQVHVHVHDSGIGIAPEHQQAIFEPFVQVESSLTRTRDGVGLGLAISRRYAREMGGELNVVSVPGGGSTFTLTLPRSPSQ